MYVTIMDITERGTMNATEKVAYVIVDADGNRLNEYPETVSYEEANKICDQEKAKGRKVYMDFAD